VTSPAPAADAAILGEDWSGPWSSGDDADTFEVDEPATGRLLARVRGAGPAEVDAAVRRAHATFSDDWRWRTARERGRLLVEAGRHLREHLDELADLESQDVGKPIGISRNYDLQVCCDSFEFFGGLAGKALDSSVNLGPLDARLVQEPYGVVAGVIPFNWPPIHTAAKTAPALATGNTVVLKPPEQAPLTILRIVELLQEVLPPGVVQVVPGGGAVGNALISHPLVGKISFTGSPFTAQRVLRAAADNLTPSVLELGGKCPILVFEDADLDGAMRGIVEGAFFNQGEACTAASRLLVHDAVYDEVLTRLVAAVPRLRVGDGRDPRTHVGPMITAVHRERVLGYVDIGRAEGATIAVQGGLPQDERLAGGHYVPPTVFSDVRQDMRIVQEEIFGPVLVTQRFSTDAEAIALANGTRFGLVSAVYTRDSTRAARLARQIDSGVVMVNNYSRAFLGSPFGGVKWSGQGREHAVETLADFTWTKSIRTPSGLGEIPTWPALSDVLDD
jgi:acyl-CoA reductase-like NAD-dependent aldehyde dehydrogenase